jgi:hypothetical protein
MCGNITEWGADLQPGGGKHDMKQYSLDFQVWRPSPTVDDSTGTGCYSLVGNNRFTSISLSNGVAQVTPSPQDYIQFQPGDVLGFYVEEASEATDGVVVLTRPSSFASELVWYASIEEDMATSQNGDCPYSVGSNGVLNTPTRAAPVISISTSRPIIEEKCTNHNHFTHSYFLLSFTTINGYNPAYPSATESHH